MEAAPAAGRRSPESVLRPSVQFRHGISADLPVVTLGPYAACAPCAVDGGAVCSVENHIVRLRSLAQVHDEAGRMGVQPSEVATVVIDEVPDHFHDVVTFSGR
jgi:hypothetical protein